MHNPDQLFELFYKNVRDDMCPPGLCRSSYRSNWWRERFMNAYHGIKEPRELMSWAEVPQMWLAAYLGEYFYKIVQIIVLGYASR